MTQDQLAATLDVISARTDKDGWSTPAEGKTLTLYAGHQGVPLTVPRVDALAAKGSILRARTVKGETFIMALEDVFAVAAEGTPAQSRKAGF